MIRRHARRAVVRLVAGFVIMAGTIGIASLFPRPENIDDWVPLILFPYLTGAAIYIWGCACLAEAKGHSTAIILVAFLSCIPGAFWLPLLLLLVLPDKHKHTPGNRRHRDRDE